MGRVTSHRYERMFKHRNTFNENISAWDVSSVTDMQQMFYYASAFNQPLNNWDVSSVTFVGYIFEGAVISINR